MASKASKKKKEVLVVIDKRGKEIVAHKPKTPHAGVQSINHVNNPQRTLQKYLSRFFSKKDASKLAWAVMVGNPFGNLYVPVPAAMTVGASAGCPRMFPITLTITNSANSLGRLYAGLNADGWLPNPSTTVGMAPVPYAMYLGNSTTYGSRGYPFHVTANTYAGCAASTPAVAGSTGLSYPAPTVTANTTLGLNSIQLPSAFITGQIDCAAASSNAFQRFQCVAAAIRARPVAPAATALVMQGTMMGVQQILGDTVITNPAAANSPSAIGGVDAYAYIRGIQGINGTAAPAVAREEISIEEVDIATWPKGDKWLTVAALPNQSCAFGQWTPGNTGNTTIGFPQCAILCSGMLPNQAIEVQAKLVYAFYGIVSYEANRTASHTPSALGDISGILTSGQKHLRPQMMTDVPNSRPGVKAFAQDAIDSGTAAKGSSIVDWIKSGSSAVEELTGSTIGELLGEGLGFLASAL